MKRIVLSTMMLALLAPDAGANCVPTWDGAIGQPGMSHSVQALAMHDDGTGEALYAGGWFSEAGGSVVNRIARWDGAGWSALGSGDVGVNGAVRALIEYDGDLIVGGQFTTAGGETMNGIARWDGSAWHPLASGGQIGVGDYEFPTVRALAVYQGDLYVGGEFLSAGGLTVNHIARWNGAAWSSLGTGINDDAPDGGSVYALEVFNGELVAGGWIFSAGGVEASRIAKWNGSTWSALTMGVSNVVRALAVFDDGLGGGEALYVGGGTNTAPGGTQGRIARWDGANWSNLGAGLNNSVHALEVFDDGSGAALYVGGTFSTAGGSDASRIARWDGVTWSTLRGGLNSLPYAMAATQLGSTPALYVGGVFSEADGIAAAGVAVWLGCAGCPADLTGDGLVGSADLAVLLGCWGVVAMGSECEKADLTGDGLVGSADLAILLGSWGACP